MRAIVQYRHALNSVSPCPLQHEARTLRMYCHERRARTLMRSIRRRGLGGSLTGRGVTSLAR